MGDDNNNIGMKFREWMMRMRNVHYIDDDEMDRGVARLARYDDDNINETDK